MERWWRRTWADLRLPEPDRLCAQLLARYAEPHRAYHTAQHLEECRGHFVRTRALASDAGAVQLALWFHDAIYDTHGRLNEERSADWAVEVLAGAGGADDVQAAVRDMILATKHDTVPNSRDAALVADIDLAILGASTCRFEEYENQIRREYSWVDEVAFRSARSRILAGFLHRPRIYSTDYFDRELGGRARANIQRALSRLGPA